MRGQGRTFQRKGSSNYWIAYYGPSEADGRYVEHRESAGKTEAEARRLLKARLQEVAVHRTGLRSFQGPRQERVMVDDLLTDLERDYEMHERKSLPQLRSRLKHVRSYFGMDRALSVSTDRVTSYIVERQREKAAPATINREVEALQSAFNLAARAEPPKLTYSPRFPSLAENNARQGFFERGEFTAVISKIEDVHVKDFCEWFFFTGMRPKGIRSLTWGDFNRETWTIKLQGKDSKTGKPLSLALVGPLRSIIERRLAARRLDCPFIFHRDGSVMGEFRKTWKTACKRAGLTGKLVYDFRRTAVRNMTRAGVPRGVAMKISGHKTESVFERYNITSDDDIREAVAKTAAYVESLPRETNIVPMPEAAAK